MKKKIETFKSFERNNKTFTAPTGYVIQVPSSELKSKKLSNEEVQWRLQPDFSNATCLDFDEAIEKLPSYIWLNVRSPRGLETINSFIQDAGRRKNLRDYYKLKIEDADLKLLKKYSFVFNFYSNVQEMTFYEKSEETQFEFFNWSVNLNNISGTKTKVPTFKSYLQIKKKKYLLANTKEMTKGMYSYSRDMLTTLVFDETSNTRITSTYAYRGAHQILKTLLYKNLPKKEIRLSNVEAESSGVLLELELKTNAAVLKAKTNLNALTDDLNKLFQEMENGQYNKKTMKEALSALSGMKDLLAGWTEDKDLLPFR